MDSSSTPKCAVCDRKQRKGVGGRKQLPMKTVKFPGDLKEQEEVAAALVMHPVRGSRSANPNSADFLVRSLQAGAGSVKLCPAHRSAARKIIGQRKPPVAAVPPAGRQTLAAAAKVEVAREQWLHKSSDGEPSHALAAHCHSIPKRLRLHTHLRMAACASDNFFCVCPHPPLQLHACMHAQSWWK